MAIRSSYVHSLSWQYNAINWTHERLHGTLVNHEMETRSNYAFFRSAPFFAPDRLVKKYHQIWREYYGN